MSQPNYRGKDYSDDWEQFERNLRAKSTFDLTYYARNLVTSVSRIEGNDDYANGLFEKLCKRIKLVNQELARRGTYNAPKSTPAERKRRLEELVQEYKAVSGDDQVVAPSSGARHDDPPIPTRVSPLVQNRPSPPFSLRTDERLSEEEEEDTEPYEHVPKKFKLFPSEKDEEKNKDK